MESLSKETKQKNCKGYFGGIIYPNLEELFKGIGFFNSTPVNAQSCEILFRELIENVKFNINDLNLRSRAKITNSQFREILDDAFQFILEKSVSAVEKNMDVSSTELEKI